MINPQRRTLVGVILLSLTVALGAGRWTIPVERVSAAPAGQAQRLSNDDCLGCHSTPGLTTTLPNGEVLYLTIDPAKFAGSAHGGAGFACVQCHPDLTSFPHPPKAAQTRRDFTIQLYTTCQRCHRDQYQKTLDSVHQRALAASNRNAAVCTDCHNPHEQARLTDPNTHQLLPEARLAIPQTCARCDSAIYAEYRQSVHGSALVENNPDVPTCIDCHGVHKGPGYMKCPVVGKKFFLAGTGDLCLLGNWKQTRRNRFDQANDQGNCWAAGQSGHV